MRRRCASPSCEGNRYLTLCCVLVKPSFDRDADPEVQLRVGFHWGELSSAPLSFPQRGFPQPTRELRPRDPAACSAPPPLSEAGTHSTSIRLATSEAIIQRCPFRLASKREHLLTQAPAPHTGTTTHASGGAMPSSLLVGTCSTRSQETLTQHSPSTPQAADRVPPTSTRLLSSRPSGSLLAAQADRIANAPRLALFRSPSERGSSYREIPRYAFRKTT